MKKAPCLAATLLLSGVFIAGACADTPDAQTPTETDNLALQDPDGVPLVISHPKQVTPTAAQIEAKRNQAKQAAQNKDWLLRSYEQQLQSRSHNSSGNDNADIYYHIASDKNLARLAGLSDLDLTPQEETLSLRTGANKSGQNAVSLRADPSAPEKGKGVPSSMIIPAFKPLITPLGAADAAGLHNFYATLPAATQPIPTATSNSDPMPNPADLDTPGKIAAENNPTLTLDKSDSLTFGALPEETLPSNGSHRAEIATGELPVATNAAQLQKITNTSLTAPGTVKTSQPVNVSSLQLKLPNDFEPVKLAPPSPVRQPIVSPMFMLDR